MTSEKRWLRQTSAWLVMGSLLAGCAPGYMKASELESREQGPTACAKSCEDLKMRMVAMVLVSNDLPGCVCQVLEQQRSSAPGAALIGAEPAPAAAPVPAVAPEGEPQSSRPASTDVVRDGAAASTAGFVVIAAAAAARQQQQRRQQQQAQQQK